MAAVSVCAGNIYPFLVDDEGATLRRILWKAISANVEKISYTCRRDLPSAISLPFILIGDVIGSSEELSY